jgi:hypothetical protein
LLAAGALLSGCGPVQASFSATGPCLADGRAPGAYPAYEDLLPREIEGRAPTSVDSGRNCTTRALGTYAAHGVGEVRFAGATWDEGGGDATVIAVLATAQGQPELRPAWVEEFYETGARSSTKTENIEVSRPVMGDAGQVYRLETLNDLSLQTVLVWSLGGPVRVVIVATQVEPGAARDAHDSRVALALEAASRAPA